jgi:5'(3')-deoxyribonucleotidase
MGKGEKEEFCLKRLFLDLDGVLADFDTLAEKLLGEPSRQFEDREGGGKLWTVLREYGTFYADLALMPGAQKLYDSVKHLNPIVLSGCDKEKAGANAYDQKCAWVESKFPGTPVIICKSAEKFKHMLPGDVIIDDYLKYKHIWEGAGGTFILYKNADQALEELWRIW